MYEIALDSLPQVCHQALVLVQLEGDDRSYLLWGSLLFSALSISYLAAVGEQDIDTSLNYRKLFARVHGYMSNDKSKKQAIVFGISMAIGGI